MLSTAMIAHEAIFEMRRELIAGDRASPEQARLLEESARIVTVELPGLSATARRLSAKWEEQSLLHPDGAGKTLEELEAEVARSELAVRPLLDRQREIAAQLRSMLES
jgi:phage-related minor tail protein